MKYTFKDLAFGMLKTSLLLICLEIFSTAALPALGLENIKLAFSVLIVLFMAFKLDTPFLAILILITQSVHSIFSVEGWAIGTLVGVVISLSVKYVRDLLNFSTAVSTMFVVQVFQLAWFAILSMLLSIKLGSFNFYFSLFWQFVPESILLSLLSPYFFKVLDLFWDVKKRGVGVGA